jgi:hypothetical protein
MFSFNYKYYRNGIELVTNHYVVALRSDVGYIMILNEDDCYYYKRQINKYAK